MTTKLPWKTMNQISIRQALTASAQSYPTVSEFGLYGRVPSLYFATGGTDSRDIAFYSCAHKPDGRMIYTNLQWGGPLDAPEVLPAGGMNSIECTDWLGEAVPVQSTTSRGFAPSK